MWCRANFDPDRFWDQSPYHFQLAMRGVREQLKAEWDNRLRHAWWIGAFSAMAQSKGGLKPLEHYLSPSYQKRTPEELLDTFRTIAGRGVPMTIVAVPTEDLQDG